MARGFISLLRRLEEGGQLTVVREPKAVCGLFGVPKDEDRLRLICDARPANSLFVAPPKIELPTPTLISRCHAPPGRRLYACKLDVQSYFNRILLPPSFHPYFCLPPVPATVLAAGRALDLPRGTLVYPALRCLPQGWSFSTYIAQMVHISVLRRARLPMTSQLCSKTTNFSLLSCRWAAYIDDWFALGANKRRLQKWMDRVKRAYKDIGLVSNRKKEVQPTDRDVKILGMVFSGADASIAPPSAKLLALIAKTRTFIQSYRCSSHALARLLGHWCWVLLLVRPTLSVLNAAYAFVYKIPGVASLWPTVRNELRTLCDIAPLLFVDLTQPSAPMVFASDASLYGQGVAAAYVSPIRIRRILDAMLGIHLDLPAQASNSREVVSNLRFHSVLSLPWRTLPPWSLLLSSPLSRE